MGEPAANYYRVERDSDDKPIGNRHLGPRMIGTALTGFPIPGKPMRFNATLRVLDPEGTVVFAKAGEGREIDALELEMLSDLLKMDVETFRAAYGLFDGEQARDE